MTREAARTAAVLLAAAMAVLAVACSGSPSSGRSTTGGGSASSLSATAEALAFTHCMRTHGVPNFPDPASDGKVPPVSAGALGLSDEQLHADEAPCVHLLPGGSGETPAQVQQERNQALGFARCMRSHGMPNWPDPTEDRNGSGRLAFNLPAAGIDLSSPQVKARIQECTSLLHLSDAPPGAQLRP